ncbi:MAG: hypothetical protein HYR62_04135 [Actinobacteria bacterium]|nr:hypothetical protein [Actinomycetota bacterium]MBI3686610.1 hypothetical protein [Actinomycetota bacterium]
MSLGMEYDPGTGVTRRAALKRGAIVGGALVWTVPVVQAISLTSAHAEAASAPPSTGGNPGTPPVGEQPPGQRAGSTPAGASGTLAYTGPTVPIVPAVAAAAGLIAAGVAAQAARPGAADRSAAQPAEPELAGQPGLAAGQA